jgi:arsenate reductase-like glutaredoxin family protein
MVLANVKGVTYHVDNRLANKWDKIKGGKLKLQDNDRVYVVDGRERTGKSVFAMQQACYIDETLVDDLSRICFSAEEFLEAIRKTDSDEKHTKCVIFDEAFRGLASRGAMSRVNKSIVQALMEVGQKNLVLWIVLPSFFMLDLYPAMIRSNALFHIAQEKGTNKRVFYVYPHSKKGILYQNGIRKGWQYNIRTKNKGRFYNNFPIKLLKESGCRFYEEYLKKKRFSLTESSNEGTVDEQLSKHQVQRDLMIYNMVRNDDLSATQVSNRLKTMGIELGKSMINTIVDKIDRARGLKKNLTYENALEPIYDSETMLKRPILNEQIQ